MPTRRDKQLVRLCRRWLGLRARMDRVEDQLAPLVLEMITQVVRSQKVPDSALQDVCQNAAKGFFSFLNT